MRVHEYLNLVYEFWDKREKCIPNEILYSSKHNLFLEYSIIFNEYYEQMLKANDKFISSYPEYLE